MRGYRLGVIYEGCHGLALAGKHTLIVFDDTLAEATVWEFPRQTADEYAPPLALVKCDILD